MQLIKTNFTNVIKITSVALILAFVFSQNFTSSVNAATGINRQINFQGKLVNNPASTNVSNTSYTVIFTFYDRDTGGTVLWQETQTVTTTDGIFRVALGSVTPFPANFNFNWTGLYLGIKVNADSEMTPRIQMAAVPFAFNAERVAGLTVQDTSGNASTSGILQVGNGKTISFADNISFGTGTTGVISLGTGSNTLTLATTGNTSLTLPQSGTLCTTVSCLVTDPYWSQSLGALFSNNSTLDFLFGSQASNSASFHLFGSNALAGTQPVASISARTSSSAYIIDQSGLGDIFSASAAGKPVLTISRSGSIGIGTILPTAKLTIKGFATTENAILIDGIGSGTGITIGGSSASIQSGTGLSIPSASINSGTAISLGGGVSGTSSFTGTYLNINPTKTNNVSSSPTDSGIYINVARSTTIANMGSTHSITGDLVRFSSNCTVTTGQCIDTAKILSLTQSYSSASGSVLFISNSGKGLAIEANSIGNTAPVASLSGQTSFAAMIVDNNGVGDLFTASKSGLSLFTVKNNGQVLLTAPYYTAACTLKTDSTGLITCGVDNNSGGAGSSPFAQITGGVIVPNNSTVDFLVGGQSTTAAKFAILNVASTTPIASIAGNIVLGSPAGTTRTIGATAMNGLQLGDSNTGVVQFFGTTNSITNTGQLTIGSLFQGVMLVKPSGVVAYYRPASNTDSARGATLESARDAASSGDTIMVGPGTYNITALSTPNLAKNGVNWYFSEGSTVIFDADSVTDIAIFGDNNTAMSFTVGGNGTFIAQNNAGVNPGFMRVLYVQNASSDISFRAKRAYTDQVDTSAITIDVLGGNVVVVAESIESLTNYAVRNTGGNLYVTTLKDMAGGGDRIINVSGGTTYLYGGKLRHRGAGGAIESSGGTLKIYSVDVVEESTGSGPLLTLGTGIVDIYSSTFTQNNTSVENTIQLSSGRLTINSSKIYTSNAATYSIASNNPSTLVTLNGVTANKPANSNIVINGQWVVNGRYASGVGVPLSSFDVSTSTASGGTIAIASISGSTSFAALTVNNNGVGDLFTASKSGLPIFTIKNNGQVVLSAPYYTAACTLKTDSTGLITCGTDNTGPGGGSYSPFQESTGAIFANNTTTDFIVGGQSTQSARFLVTANILGAGTKVVASVAGQTSYAAFVVDQSGVGDLIAASAAGNTLFVVRNNGSVMIGGARADEGYKLDVQGSARIGNNTGGDDIFKQTTSDFTQSGYSVTQSDSVNNVSTSGNQISLVTDMIDAGATPTSPTAGPAVGVNVAAGGYTFQRPDRNFITIIGGSNGGTASTKMYNVTTNTFDTSVWLNNWIPTTGFKAFQRADSKFVLLPGGSSTNTLIYDPAGSNNFGLIKIGPPLATGSIGAGSQVIKRSDGWFIVINGNSLASTNVYNPAATSSAGTNQTAGDLGTFLAGPSLTGNVTTGSFAFQKPNGQWIIGLGGGTTTNVYDPFTTPGSGVSGGGTFSAGPSLGATSSGAGAHAIQLPDGRWMVVLGGGSAATAIYNPTSNAFSAGPSLAGGDTVGAGGHSFQRSDGKWIVVIGGNSKNLQLYDPSSGADGSFTQLTGASGLQGATGAGDGAHTFQRPDGMYVIVHGNSTGLTTLYDGGWNTSGSWTSEDLNSTKISTYSALMWSSNPQSANNNARLDAETLTFSIKTADTQALLSSAPWRQLQDSGDIIKAYDTTRWVKIKVDFSTPVRSYQTGATSYVNQRNTWGGEGETFYRRTFIQPAVFNMKVVNPLVSYGDPSGAGDPAFGRNFATGSAILEGVVTDNSNWLKLQTIRNLQVATPSGGFMIASASANLGTTSGAGAGAHAIERSNGTYIIIAGNNSTQTRVYDPDANSFTDGPALPFAAGAGAHSFLMPDGRFFVVLGNTTNNTAIFDTQASVFIAGPKLFCNAAAGANTFQRPDGFFMILCAGNTRQTSMLDPYTMGMMQGPFPTLPVGNGSMNIRRPDGRIVVLLGQAQTVTNIYDPATNAFLVGPAITTSNVTTGSSAIQLNTGKWIIKTSTTATNTYDPITNITAVGPTSSANSGAGSAIIPRSDGKFLLIHGGNVATTSVFDPQLSVNAQPAGPALPCNVNTGGFVFQRQTAEYVVICGGSTNNTVIVDAGWNLGGTYTSEQIYEPNLSTITGMYWKNAGSGKIYVKYRTASSQTALGLASWKQLPKAGSLLNISAGDVWFQTRIDLQGELQDAPGAKTRVWLASDSGGNTVYYRNVSIPILQYWKLMNAQDPSLLTITSNGSSAFRFSADGQAYTADNGAWNSGGADLAERYTSTQELQPGEVVVGDRLKAQNVIRSTDTYQTNIMGVVSTQPGFVAGSYTPNSFPIALVGRVPVKISTENGPIHAGDYLTSASIPGYAMKATLAGRVLGTALEDFDETTATDCPSDIGGVLPSTKCGTITAFINLTNYNGEKVEMLMAEKGFNSSEETEVNGLVSESGLSSYTNTLSVKDRNILTFLEELKNQGDSATLGSEIFTGRLSAINIISPNIIADLITAKRIRADHIEGLEILTNQISALENSVSVLGSATDSANLNNLPGELNLTSLNINGLATVSGSLTVQGNSLVQGVLDVLDSISTPKLLVSDFASFFGNVFFKKNVQFEGRPTFNSDTAGFAVINKGDKEVEIQFSDEYLNEPIITASIALDKTDDPIKQKELEDEVLSGNISYVITNKTTKGFVIKLNKAATDDITFSWVALSINQAKTVKSKDRIINFNPDSTNSAAFQSILRGLGN
jgi:hypothetical protein